MTTLLVKLPNTSTRGLLSTYITQDQPSQEIFGLITYMNIYLHPTTLALLTPPDHTFHPFSPDE